MCRVAKFQMVVELYPSYLNLGTTICDSFPVIRDVIFY
jgi:hypothetical protein